MDADVVATLGELEGGMAVHFLLSAVQEVTTIVHYALLLTSWPLHHLGMTLRLDHRVTLWEVHAV